ncbi:MAG TPA: GntR family transcriptional regulator [Thermoanaerobacterales bacterium]|uniref:GntR family transcriptional regulator n=1 Tax=Tepidanaerobacter sp. GT38 TaxID=2722793 RepID=UPI001800F561|nr:GntR family transcriptional regulator [Tepidanaerobacter sp. GT38]MCG1013192.1 GntR family transcriptional regulator [Tepidanaerobacter sp. GT38]HHY41378.1 GntR family transcriptional regulator [Thermoanaerobacterales bacterium]
MSSKFEFFQFNTLVDMAYEELKKDITLNVLKPGQRIIVRDLCNRYGISETPIKQALNRLLMEGLIESVPRRNMTVKRIRLRELDELLEIRYMIEIFYVDKVLETLKNNPVAKEKFIANLTEHEKVAENIENINDYYKHFSLDRQFHQLYVECSGNEKALDIYKKMETHIYMYYVYGKQTTTRIKEAVQEHKAIFDALMFFDKNLVLEMIKRHFNFAKQDIHALWEKTS